MIEAHGTDGAVAASVARRSRPAKRAMSPLAPARRVRSVWMRVGLVARAALALALPMKGLVRHTRRTDERSSGRPPLWWRTELLLFLGAYLVYWTARWVFVGDAGTAQANAAAIWDLEQATGTAIELSVQRTFDSAIVSTLSSNLYLAAQIVILPAAIVWLYRRSPPIYRKVRTTIIATWMLSVPIVAAFPVAPPRLANLGFTDTVSDQAAVALTGSSTDFYNAFAAVPSLHVGFAFALSFAGVAAVRSPWAKLLAASWGPLVTLIVIATGNHYVFDAVAGIAVTAVGFTVYKLTAHRENLLALITRPLRTTAGEGGAVDTDPARPPRLVSWHANSVAVAAWLLVRRSPAPTPAPRGWPGTPCGARRRRRRSRRPARSRPRVWP